MAVSFHIFIGTHTYVYVLLFRTVGYSFSLSVSVCPVVHIRAYESYERDRQFRITRQTKGFLFSFSLLSGALSLLRLSSPYRMTLSLIPVCVCVCGYVYTYTEHFFSYYYSLFYSLILFELDRIV
jgi:hypothetical protein